jgi:hypothetical protein
MRVLSIVLFFSAASLLSDCTSTSRATAQSDDNPMLQKPDAQEVHGQVSALYGRSVGH